MNDASRKKRTLAVIPTTGPMSDDPWTHRSLVVNQSMLHRVLNRFTWSVKDDSQANVLIKNDSSAGAVAFGTNMEEAVTKPA